MNEIFWFLQEYPLFSPEPNPRDAIETKRNLMNLSNIKPKNKQTGLLGQQKTVASDSKNWLSTRDRISGGWWQEFFWKCPFLPYALTCMNQHLLCYTEYQRTDNQLSLCWGQQNNTRAISELGSDGISRQSGPCVVPSSLAPILYQASRDYIN